MKDSKDEKVNSFTYEKSDLINIIEKSNLDGELKEAITLRFDIGDIDQMIIDGTVICSLDACLDVLQRNNIPYETDEEDDIAEKWIQTYFKQNLKGFPLNIMTEDFVGLYKAQ